MRKCKASSESTLLNRVQGRERGSTLSRAESAAEVRRSNGRQGAHGRPKWAAVAMPPAVAPTVEKSTSAAFEAAQKSRQADPDRCLCCSSRLPCKARHVLHHRGNSRKTISSKYFVFLRMDFGGQREECRAEVQGQQRGHADRVQGREKRSETLGRAEPTPNPSWPCSPWRSRSRRGQPARHRPAAKFTGEAFEAAEKAGKLILIDVDCFVVSDMQGPGASSSRAWIKNEKFMVFVSLKINFDGQKVYGCETQGGAARAH